MTNNRPYKTPPIFNPCRLNENRTPETTPIKIVKRYSILIPFLYNDFMTNTRPYKGNCLLKLLDDYTVIDIETSMNGRIYGEIIEIGAIKVRNNQVIDTFDQLIKPTQPIDSWTQSIHHISNAMVKDKPPIDVIYPLFLKFIENDLLVGHNVHFDLNYLYDYHQELNQPPLSNDFVDTLRLARRTLKGLNSYSLSNLSIHFGFSETNHRAVDDALATHRLYQQLKNRLSKSEIDFLANLKPPQSNAKPKSLQKELTLFDNIAVFKEKAVVFSGRFNRFTRKQAAQIIINSGGHVLSSLHPNVDYLIVGEYRQLSSKHQQALRLQSLGYPIQILSQQAFIELIDLG